MDPRYALYIWLSFGIAMAVVLWNLVAPALARKAVVQRLRDADGDAASPLSEND